MISRIEHQQRENKQHQEEHHVEVQHHVDVQQHNVMDEGDGQKSNHTHPKLDIKNFHTQLW